MLWNCRAKSRKAGKNYAIGPFVTCHFYTRVQILNLLQQQEVTSFLITILAKEGAAEDLAATFDLPALESNDDPSRVLRDSCC